MSVRTHRGRRAPFRARDGETPAQRRERLLLQSAALRIRLGHEVRGLERPLAFVDSLADGARWLGRHPQLPLAAVALTALLRPRRVLGWAARGLTVWQLWQRVGRIAGALLRPGR